MFCILVGNQIKSMNFVKKYKNKSIAFWENISFTDESEFEMKNE